MPSSSLDSLSSPSPSPAPMDQAHAAPDVDPAALDSGSELSDLTEDDPQPSTSGPHHASQDAPRQRRKKRGGIIPPRMWDWALKGTNPEEEEEDQPDPPPILEEEEDEEDHLSAMHRRHTSHLLSNGAVPIRPGPALNGAAPDDLSDEDEDEDEDEDDEPGRDPVRLPRTGASLASVKPLRATSAELTDDDDVSGTEGENDDEDDEVSSKHPNADNTLVEQDAESEGSDAEDEDEEAALPGDEDDMDPITPLLVAPAVSTPADALMEVDMDVTAPPASLVGPIVVAAAQSSIMAGSTVIEEPSPSSSASSSPSPSVASSRSASPAPLGHTGPKPLSKAAAEKKIAVPTSTSAPAGADPEDVEVEVDDEPEPEADALEADLQPAHRAEALDMLALIELKFALLRERLYVEKMEQLAWEEKLIDDGIHPELIHLHDELLKRRNIRIELATRKRSHEVDMTTRRREVEEDAVWSTWKFQRDQLQTDMIAEANRKRRRLEREQKALSRPVPIRRIPVPPVDVPPAPTLREILKAQPFAPAPSDARPARSGSRRKAPSAALPNSYPELHALAPSEVMNDLGLLFQQRRNLDYQRQLQAGTPSHPHDAYPPTAPPPQSMTNGLDPRTQLHGYGAALPLDGGPSLAVMDVYGQPMLAQVQQGYPPSLIQGRQHHHMPGSHMMDVDPMYQPQHTSVPPPSYGGQLPMRRSPSPGMGGGPSYPPNGWTDEQYRRMNEMEAQRRPKDRDREPERRREMRDAERDRAKEPRGRDRDRDRERNMQMDAAQHQQQQQQHRMHSHAHAHSGSLPPPGQGPSHPHAQGPHHHHHHHHHRHVHGPQGSYGSVGPSSAPPSTHPLDTASGALIGSHHNQRVPPGREIDLGKPSPSTSATEINLAPSSTLGPRSAGWETPHGNFAREREREREWEREKERERERERERDWTRPSSSHSMHSTHDERPPMPFVIPPSSHSMHMNGHNSLAGSGRSSFSSNIGNGPEDGVSLAQPIPSSHSGAVSGHQPTPPGTSRGAPNGTLGQPRDQMLPPPPVPSRPHSSLMSPSRHNGPLSPGSAVLGSPARPTPLGAPSFLPPPAILAGIGSDTKDGLQGGPPAIPNGRITPGSQSLTSPPPLLPPSSAMSFGPGPFALPSKVPEPGGPMDRARSVTPGTALPIPLPPQKMGVA